MAEKKIRRRGQALVDAILAATWEQLQAKGYRALTIEGVARAAATTKTVLYRRWPDKAHLVLAALSKYDNFTGYVVPDTGALRTDLLDLMGQIAAFLEKLKGETFRGLLAERLQHLELDKLMSRANGNAAIRGIMQPMLDRAAKRGEITRTDWPDRVINLVGILLINEVVSRQELSQAARNEMVDDILLPVFGQQGNSH